MTGLPAGEPVGAPAAVRMSATPCRCRLGWTSAEGPMRALADWVLRYGDELFEAQERGRSAYT